MHTQLLSEQEAAAMRLLPFGRKHPVRLLIEALKPGEKLNIARMDFEWKGKTPNFFCRQLSRAGRGKFRIFKKADRSGWVVMRVE